MRITPKERRALRKSMGCRSTRRSGTKTKVIRGRPGSGGHQPPKYRNPRTQRERPRSRLGKLIEANRQTQE